MYEPVLLYSLPYDLLSVPTLQCRDGTEKRNIPYCFDRDLLRLLCSNAASYADYDIWSNDDCFLCSLQHCCEYFSIPFCAENISVKRITEQLDCRKSIRRNEDLYFINLSEIRKIFFKKNLYLKGWKLLVDTFQGENGCLQPLNLISLRCLSKSKSILRRSEYDFSR